MSSPTANITQINRAEPEPTDGESAVTGATATAAGTHSLPSEDTPTFSNSDPNPNSSTTSVGPVVVDRSISPELESLSSGSETEEQFYEAPEESPAQENDESLSKDNVVDANVEDDVEESNLEPDKDDGVQEDLSISSEQHPVGSIEREFIMVNYPSRSGTDSSIKTLHIPASVSTPVADSSTVQTGFGDEEESSQVKLLDAVVSSAAEVGTNDPPCVSGTLNQTGGAESAQGLDESSREAMEEQQLTVGCGREAEGEETTVEKKPGKDGEKGNVNVPAFESLGLLYARSPNLKHDRDLLKPADEVAEDVLEVFTDIEASELLDTPLSPEAGRERQLGAGYSIIDPGALFEMEKQAQTVATELSHVMDNLRNSLHAMTVCTKQSIQLHRESIDNLHTVVDTNIKGMYTFMAKFEELNKSLGPLKDIAAQIHDVDEKLKILEQLFRVTATKGSAQSSIRTASYYN